jgi:hypothetical protein
VPEPCEKAAGYGLEPITCSSHFRQTRRSGTLHGIRLTERSFVMTKGGSSHSSFAIAKGQLSRLVPTIVHTRPYFRMRFSTNGLSLIKPWLFKCIRLWPRWQSRIPPSSISRLEPPQALNRRP